MKWKSALYRKAQKSARREDWKTVEWRRYSSLGRKVMEKVESKLIPILREGVDVVKMILFRRLKDHLFLQHPEFETSYVNKLAGAVINDLFGTPNTVEPFATFVRENRGRIDEQMGKIAENFQEMRIPLTDALRIQFLCDYQDGIDSEAILSNAKELGILIVDRDVPLPASFMNLVRRLGGAYGILVRHEI